MRHKKRNIVPCGKCNFCLAANHSQWIFRLKQQMKIATTAKFLTLTYNGENLPVTEWGEMNLDKEHVQLFMKRLRKEDTKNWAKSSPRGRKRPLLRYYLVGEYGTKLDRPHYHAIMFNLNQRTVDKLPQIWGKGNTHVGDVTDGSIHYVTKYVINRYGDYTDRQKPFAHISKGIGKSYLVNEKWHKDHERTYVIQDQFKIKMPRYYKDKVFDEFEREMLKLKNAKLTNKIKDAELARLAKLHPDPLAYYHERIQTQHEMLYQRLNDKNKF